jgi:HrpA-like RNA helicase
VTIEGVTAVIDSGLARVAADSPWTGLPSLDVRRISQASATQRGGRAGRTAPGRVIRLYSAEDFHRRPAADVPEIARRELSQMLLHLRAMKISALDWLDAPPEAALAAANALLDRLGVTPAMAELPLPPRLSKLVLEAASRGVPEKGCVVAAVLSAGERGTCDLLTLIESDWLPHTRRVYDQLRRLVPGRGRKTAGDDALLQSVLAAERVEQVTALVYDQLVVEETRAPAPATAESAQLLAEKALEADLGRFVDRDALAQLRARASFAGIEIDAENALVELCRGRTSFVELASADLLAALRPRRLAETAPERLRLPAGREVPVHYDPGKPPWIESRLQDFFGVAQTPRINGIPVVVHLLAPNRRPVQVTTDLAGFWERLYPQVRRELSRRYPKHKWPEKP